MATAELETFGHANPLADDEAIVSLAKQCLFHGDPVAVEVGAWTGSTTVLLADLGFRTFAVDHWKGSEGDSLQPIAAKNGQAKVLSTFCENMGNRLLRTVFPWIGDALLIASVWPRDVKIAFLLIDADHRYEAALSHITAWSRLVAPGGIIAIHDYGVFEGVTRAIEETGPFTEAGECIAWRRA